MYSNVDRGSEGLEENSKCVWGYLLLGSWSFRAQSERLERSCRLGSQVGTSCHLGDVSVGH
jgi:hypothetical protein